MLSNKISFWGYLLFTRSALCYAFCPSFSLCPPSRYLLSSLLFKCKCNFDFGWSFRQPKTEKLYVNWMSSETDSARVACSMAGFYIFPLLCPFNCLLFQEVVVVDVPVIVNFWLHFKLVRALFENCHAYSCNQIKINGLWNSNHIICIQVVFSLRKT